MSLALILILLFSYCMKKYLLLPKIQKYIYNTIGDEVKFGDFHISPFSITVNNLKMNGVFKAHKIVFKINPLRIFTCTNFEDYISKINISKLELFLSKNNFKTNCNNILLDKNILFRKLCKYNLRISIKKLAVKSNIEIYNTNIILSNFKIIIDSDIHLLSHVIKFHTCFRQNMESMTFTTTSSFTSLGAIKISLKAQGCFNFLSLDFCQKIFIEKLSYKGFKFNNISGFISKTACNYTAYLQNTFGKINLNLLNNIISINSFINISKINNNFSGYVSCNFKKSNSYKENIEINITNLKFFGINYGSFKFLAVKNNYKTYNTFCVNILKEKSMTVPIKEKYSKYFIIKNKTILFANDKQNNKIVIKCIDDISSIFLIIKYVKGFVNLSGFINKTYYKINLLTNKFYKLKNIEAKNVVAIMFKNNKKSLFNMIQTASNIQKSEINFDVTILNGILFRNNKFKEIKAIGTVNTSSKMINLKKFIINNCNKIIAKRIRIEFLTGNFHPHFNVNITNLNLCLHGLTINGYININFYLNNNGINSIIQCKKIKICGVLLKNVTINSKFSTKNIEITNIKLNDDINIIGNILIEFKNSINTDKKQYCHTCPLISFNKFQDKKSISRFLIYKSKCVKTVKLNDVKFSIDFDSGNIMMKNSTVIKFLNNKINLNNGFLNIKKRKYGFNLSLANSYINFIDFSCNVNLFGEIINKNHFLHKGIIDFNNLCINKHKLFLSNINYKIKNGKIFISSKVANSVKKYDLSGIFDFTNFVFMVKINFSNDKSIFHLFIKASKTFVNFIMKGTNIESNLIVNIFNFPNIITCGYVNINMNLFGDINSGSGPKGNMLMSSNYGYLLGIPYDNFLIKTNFCNNQIYIDNFVFKKNGEIDIIINGYLPFLFNKTPKKEFNKLPFSISYTINDYNLNILKFLTKRYIHDIFGKMFFKGVLEGTFKDPIVSGKFLIIDGFFESNKYFSKVRDLSVDISLIKNLLKFNKFNLKSGHGELNIYGQLVLKRFNIDQFDIKVVTSKKGIPICIPQLPVTKFIGKSSILKDYSKGEPNFNIRIYGNSLTHPKIEGYIKFENTRFSLTKAIQIKNCFIPKNTEFDLKFLTASNTKFENSFISTFINGFLNIKGHYGSLEINGIIKTLNGKINYLGTVFNISKATIEIIKDTQIYITATCETILSSKINKQSKKTVKFTINKFKISDLYDQYDDILNSALNNLKYIDNYKLNFIEKSQINHDKQLISITTFNDAKFMAKQKILRSLNQSLTIPLIRTVLKKSGFVDDFKISYINNYDKNINFITLLSGTKFSLEKKIFDKMIVKYSIVVNELNKKLNLHNVVELKYKLMNNLYFLGRYELDPMNKLCKPNRKIIFKHTLEF
ncbi:MAG: hypothetical protein LBQ07_00485 [Endomicrobium sp.]|jgi:hypothetical protein|nr:hypothetical protein [Endomicrobium sp.]